MIDTKILDDLLATGWIEDNNPTGRVPTVAGTGKNFAWKLKEGAPADIKKQFEEFQALSEWDNKNREQALMSKSRKQALSRTRTSII